MPGGSDAPGCVAVSGFSVPAVAVGVSPGFPVISMAVPVGVSDADPVGLSELVTCEGLPSVSSSLFEQPGDIQTRLRTINQISESFFGLIVILRINSSSA